MVSTLHTETLVQNIMNVVRQSSGPSCSQNTPHIVCVFLKYGTLVAHGLNPTFCLADRLLPSNTNHIKLPEPYVSENIRNDCKRYDLEIAMCFSS